MYGNIPDTLGSLTVLTLLDLSTNNITGTIPSTLADLVSLQQLYLNSNNLSGTIPPELGNLILPKWFERLTFENIIDCLNKENGLILNQ